MKEMLTGPLHALMALIVLVTMMLAMSEDSSKWLRSWISPKDRDVLSALDASLIDSTPPVRVVKVQTSGAILVEFYESSSKAQLIQRLQLAEKRDAFVSIAGRITNLLVDDIDGDGSRELLVPTYDENLTARINVVKYNAATQKFELVTANPSVE